MEMNKDEAVKCNNLAKLYLKKNNYAQAVKFFEKSLRLYPLPGVEAMRDRAKAGLTGNKTTSTPGHSVPPKPAAKATPSATTRPYTIEQTKIVKKIKMCKDYYEVLDVPRDADENAVKRSYKKLALKLHPDKNTAPGAEDAFKSVGKAFAVLTDPDRRAHYDRYGEENDSARASESSSRQRQSYREEMSPEDIFNMFFGGGGLHQARSQQRHRQQQQQQQHTQQPVHSILQYLPLIVLFLFSMVSFPEHQKALFSMQPTQEYPVSRETRMNSVVTGIPYHVQKDFDRKYARNWRDLLHVEKSVEQQHVHQLDVSCASQRTKQQRLLDQARATNDEIKREKAMRKAVSFKAPACDALRELRQRRF